MAVKVLELNRLPEDVIGEIIDGELHLRSLPDEPYARAAFNLSLALGLPFYRGIDGPGGWVFLAKLKIQFGEQILVPDLAGWRQERSAPNLPDWICEILSPSTKRHDRIRKLPIYARNEVRHAWLVDPVLRTLEILRLEAGTWSIVGLHEKNDRVRAEPFEAIEIDLSEIWGAAPIDENGES